jgi:hypothetical protein
MQNRLALVIASTAGLIVLLAGIGLALIFKNTGPLPDSLVAGAVSSPVMSGNVQADPVSDLPSIQQQVQLLIDSREEAHRQALDDANSRLQQANAQLQQAYAIIDTLRQAGAPPAPPTPAPQPTLQAQQDQTAPTGQQAPTDPTPNYDVSPDEAAAIALIVEPGGTVIKTPDLVSFQGTPAYEVQLDLGTVYVDADSRSVLYDAAAPAQSTVSTSSNNAQEENEGGEGND